MLKQCSHRLLAGGGTDGLQVPDEGHLAGTTQDVNANTNQPDNQVQIRTKEF
jgi:hypothetical protein